MIKHLRYFYFLAICELVFLFLFSFPNRSGDLYYLWDISRIFAWTHTFLLTHKVYMNPHIIVYSYNPDIRRTIFVSRRSFIVTFCHTIARKPTDDTHPNSPLAKDHIPQIASYANLLYSYLSTRYQRHRSHKFTFICQNGSLLHSLIFVFLAAAKFSYFQNVSKINSL